MTLAPLWPDLLYLALLGPGQGESLLLRVPPSSWAVIDCTCSGRRVLPLDLLQEVGADGVVGVALTHPHADHARGLHRVLDAFSSVDWIGCVVTPPGRASSYDLEDHLRKGGVRMAMDAIHSAWDRRPETRWELCAGTTRRAGDAVLHALLPTASSLAAWSSSGEPLDANSTCSPFLLEWHDCRLLLGADALEASWEQVAPEAEVHRHDLYKVAHHASLTGLNPRVLSRGTDGEQERLWAVTPWNAGPRKLPRFEDGEGVHMLLTHVNKVHLTSLPFRPATQPRGCAFARRQVEDLRKGAEVVVADGLTLEPVPAACDAVDGIVWVGLDATGAVRDVRYGPDSLVVFEGGA